MADVLYPQSIVKVNGEAIPWLDWQIENNVSATADTFSVVISKTTLEAKGAVTNTYLFRTEDDIYVEIFLGFANSPGQRLAEKDMRLLLNGFVDRCDWRFRQNSVELSGRDKTALFLDSEITEKFTNYSVEQVIQKLGAAKGLTVVIDPQVVGRTKKVGAVSNAEQALVIDGMTEWDLMTSLAREEGRDLFVRGNQLVYRDVILPYLKKANFFRWGDNLENIELTREFKGRKQRVAVTVRSYHTGAARPHSYTAVAGADTPKDGLKKRNRSQTKPAANTYDFEYVVNIPNLAPAEVKVRAETMVREIYNHELLLSFDAPMRADYDMDRVIYLEQVPIPANQYFIPRVMRLSMNADQGARVNFTCVNHVLPIKEGS